MQATALLFLVLLAFAACAQGNANTCPHCCTYLNPYTNTHPHADSNPYPYADTYSYACARRTTYAHACADFRTVATPTATPTLTPTPIPVDPQRALVSLIIPTETAWDGCRHQRGG